MAVGSYGGRPAGARRGEPKAPAPPARAEAPSTADSRDDVLLAIAELDVRFEKGLVDRATWSTERSKLKEKATAASVDGSS